MLIFTDSQAFWVENFIDFDICFDFLKANRVRSEEKVKTFGPSYSR